MLPKTFKEWQHCITVDCGIELNAAYVTERIKILSDLQHKETPKFTKHYGEAHTKQVLRWFQEAQKTL